MQQLIGLLRTMRPKQWTKNSIVYAGLVFDGQLFIPESFMRVTLTFILLCFISSTIYIINDIVDIERDRMHPKKRHRALPSGQLSVQFAQIAVVILALVTIIVSLLLNVWLTVILLVYLVTHILYAFIFKHIVIIDVLAITAGYVLRVAAGVLVIGVAAFSPWLYVSTALLALFLAIGKRRQELLMLVAETGTNAEKIRITFEDYNLPMLDNMLQMVMTGTLITYTLYTIEVESAMLAGTNLALLTVPFVLYAIFRYLYLMHVVGEGSAPDEVLLKDRPLQISIMLWGVTFIIILYVAPSFL